MKKDKIHLSIRMNQEQHDKFKWIAEYDGRSMSGQILFLINSCIRDFEKQHGKIDLK